MARALVLDGPRTLRVEERDTLAPGPREVCVRALVSGVSHGTELNLYRGTSAFADRVFDRDLRAFVTPEPPRPTYPASLGYELVGRVEAVGEAVEGFAVGDLVHAGAPHADQVVVDLDVSARSTYPLITLPDDGAPLERWLFASLGAVALVAVHDARIKLGDHVVVAGLGAIGLLVVQMARLAGAGHITAFDPLPARRELALALGADDVLDPLSARDGAGAESKRRTGRGADVAIETSGVTAGIHDAMAAAGLGARVVLLGFYQGGAPEVRFGEEWHHNRLDLISSMGAWGAPHRDHPSWDRARVMRTVVDLLASGRLAVDGLPVRRFPFDQVVDAFAWLDEHPGEAVKVALAYDGTNPS